jgi:hypothetical protein
MAVILESDGVTVVEATDVFTAKRSLRRRVPLKRWPCWCQAAQPES